jgi:hypothetical protein
MKKYLSVLATVIAALGFMGGSAEAAKKKAVVVVTPAPAPFWAWGPWGVRDPALATSNAVVSGAATLTYFGLKDGKHGWRSNGTGISSGGAYALTSVACAAVSPIIGTIVTRRELTQREVLVSAANCFVPFIGGWIMNAQFDAHPEWEMPRKK